METKEIEKYIKKLKELGEESLFLEYSKKYEAKFGKPVDVTTYKIPSKEFVLPEKWCVRDCKEVSQWASEKFDCDNSISVTEKYLCVNMPRINEDDYIFLDKKETGEYTEITFEQFKKFVMKEEKSPEDKLLEEAKRRYPIGSKFHPVHTPKDECIITNTTFSYNKNGSPGTSRENITALTDEGEHFSSRAKYGNTSSDRVVWTKDDGWAEIILSPKEIKEWSVGSYVVFLEDYGGYSKGTVDTIEKDYGNGVSTVCRFYYETSPCNLTKDTEAKWFATKEEAEEYSKSITEKKEVGELEGFKVGEEVEIVRNGAYISGISSGNEPIKGSTRTIQHFNRPIKGIYDWYVTFTDGSVFGGNKGELYKYIKHISSPKEEVKEKEMKFEVGKWYKNPDWGYKDSYYGKLTDVVPKDLSIFPSKEYIRNGEYRNSGNYFTSAKNCVEVPLEEIQQYLPEGHVDKFPKDVEYKAGDWVVVLPNDIYYDNCEKEKAQKIVKILKGDSLPYRLEFSDGHTNTYHSIRHATPEEIQKAKGEKPMTEFVKDKWYIFKDNPLKIACYQGNGGGCGFWGDTDRWSENLSISVVSSYREATDKEVEEALLAYAKKKYPKGTTYNSSVNKSRVNESSGDLHHNGKDSFNRIIDRENGNLIFDQRNGFWAEIISTPVFDHKALLDQKQYIMGVDPVKGYPMTPDEVYDFDYEEVSKVRVELIKVESIL